MYDPDQRCGENQELRGDVCVCAPDFVLQGDECVACGDHAEERDGKCVCEAGFLAGAEGGCEPSADGLGAACDTQTSLCSGSEFDFCHVTEGTTGYCTSGHCASDEDCPVNHACETREDPSYCARRPTGQGASCSTSSDCADYDAKFCESFQTNQCLVRDCAEATDCYVGWECCTIAQLGMTLCLPEGTCP